MGIHRNGTHGAVQDHYLVGYLVALAECVNSDVLDGEGGRESEREGVCD